MKSVTESQQLSVRVAPELARLVDEVAAARMCDRSDAVRHIILVGAPLVLKARNVNVDRLLQGLEILVIDCLRRAEESNPKDVELLVKAASTNVETFHV
ncbi:hypothetical protein [Novosphingobium sp. HII-3]|uniref:hypothetical protein n=1 Tax=Novosphingobium sp. HII-3 TaxID=2075565 RepID=UPI000CDA6FB6|nr:hypothetical protein [Novosphingobium sp. HII-3]